MPIMAALMLPMVDAPAPTLDSVSVADFGGDLCTGFDPWTIDVSWFTTNQNDVHYRIDIDYSIDSTSSSFSSLATDKSTGDSFYTDNTGISGNTGGFSGEETFYRTYRVKLVRRSDLAVIDTKQTTRLELTTYTDECI